MAESIQEKREARRQRRREEAENPEEDKGITEGKGRATPSRRKGEVGGSTGDTKSNPVVRAFSRPVEYLQGVRSEMEKVTWPTQEETNRLTRIVGIVLIASALFLGGLSIMFTEIFNIGVEQPWVFILIFVIFVALLFAYGRYADRSETPDF